MTPDAATHALVIECRAGAEEAVIVALWEAGTSGIEELAGARLRAHFARRPSAALLERIRRSGGRDVACERVEAEDWVRRSRAHERARRVGPLLIRPIWSRARPGRGEHDLVIDSPRAFGTGSHQSTRLALRLLLRCEPAVAALDVGTGSGILALAALRLGCRQVVAVDVDEEAIRGAVHNAEVNGLTARLRPVLGEVDCVARRFPLVMANLTAPIALRIAAPLAERVAVGGGLILSGLLRAERARVIERYAGVGLTATRRASDGEWAAVTLMRGRE